MTIVERHLTNSAYGKRAATPAPVALACIHITGNARTAAYTDLHAAADAERDYANRAGSSGPSAHYYVARDGWAIEAINPNLYWAWSNGDIKEPNTDNPGIRRVLAKFRDQDLNINRAYWLEFENVGYGPDGYPITRAQKQFCAERIAAMAKLRGMKVNRETVHGHWEINGVDRRSCPGPYKNREELLGDIIARANAILNPPAPAPAPAQEDDMPALTSYIPGQVAEIGTPQANVRSAPSISATTLVRTLAAPETWIVTGWVKGELDPDTGSDAWLVRWGPDKHWEYTAKGNVTKGPAPAADTTPVSQAELDAEKAKTAAALKRVSAIKGKVATLAASVAAAAADIADD